MRDLDHDCSCLDEADVVVQKLMLLVDQADDGDTNAQQIMKRFQQYVEASDVAVVDPISAIQPLRSRDEMARALGEIAGTDIDGTLNTNLKDVIVEPLFYTAPFAVLSQEEMLKKAEGQVGFPAILKNLTAASSQAAHELAEALSHLSSTGKTTSYLLQRWVNHSGIIHKVFVVGSHIHTVVRPSFRDVSNDEPIFPFDSQRIPKSFEGSDSPFAGAFALDDQTRKEARALKLDERKVQKIVEAVTHKLGLTLFGLDIVVEKETGRWFLIDINYCPGYDGVPDFHRHLLEVLKSKAKCHGRSA
ncbi:inositol-tetrakisphosphate 1-kinase [Gaertneriomyces semiglobifer]|nr:inositol-tetrakisphosphate 1-kinase [Gaertneriomyces semiglobifer]